MRIHLRWLINFTGLCFLTSACQVSESRISPEYIVYPLNSSIRALETIDKDTCWFAGSNGLVGFTSDGGSTWTLDTIRYDTILPEFRSIAVTDSAVFILSVGSPALLYRKKVSEKSWELVFKDEYPGVFYNSLKFWDYFNGIAVGDPINGSLHITVTKNGGKTWRTIPAAKLPSTLEGEANFAASNTNICVKGDNTWIVTGGKAARVFKSTDRGESWAVYTTPIIQGGKMTGIFSVDFYDKETGIIWGGDWENQQNNLNSKAISKDGGKSWVSMNDSLGPGYRSCVQFVPGSGGKEVFAVGIPGISYSSDGGDSWEQLSDSSFYTIRINKSGRSAWLAGKNKTAKMSW